MTAMNPAATSGDSRRQPRTVTRALRALSRRRLAASALLILLLVTLAAVLGPVLSPHDPNAQDLVNRLKPPSGDHWLGTDQFGRDVATRLLIGARVSLLAAVEALAVGAAIGIPLGLLAGYHAGRLDAVLGRFFDGLMSLPALILAMTIVAILGPGLTKAMFAVGLIFAPRYFRVARAVAMEVRQETYIEAARALGSGHGDIISRHVLPNVSSPLIVQASVLLGTAVTAEASLSFIGLGALPPTASWGSMLSGAYSYMNQAPILVIAPGLMISVTVLAFTILGDALRDLVGVKTAIVEGA